MDDAIELFKSQITVCMEDLVDPRLVNCCDHSLFNILAIALLAVTCGGDEWTDLETFGKKRKDWLATFLDMPNGPPSHDTFRRVFGLLERDAFAACLFKWTQALHEATGGDIIAIDGKALRRSLEKKDSGLAMLHLVTAWSTENGLTLGQVTCEEKSNEITAIPKLLKLLDLKGAIVTIDAMGTQTAIAEQIREGEGHYVLALKGNQSGTQDDMQALFNEAMECDFEGFAHDVYTQTGTNHGWIEERTCHTIEIPEGHRQRERWKDLRTLAVTVSCHEINGEEHWESRSYISSLPPNAKSLGNAIRKHWTIENSQHWVLDVAFDEDRRRQRDRNGAANLAAVRRLAASLLRQEQTLKRGTKCKRMACALDPDYLVKVLQTANF